ncbi:MAG: serine/threonine protein kinase [Labilithrix sp.]|nr:serine/threonine protein kinase [Labilithrix sp.]MCW5811170.1 serine/threonine protein kinase [Labilithrix sp.]
MGAVYSAFDEKLERDVALKVLHDEGEAPAQRKRLLREARIAAKLQHPNIATIYEVEELEGVLYIVMELLEGIALRRALMERRLGMEEAIGVARDMARGLAKAHAAGVVHRDIKPENIFLTTLSADTVLAKVLDFGLARQRPQPAVPGLPQEERTTTNTTSRGDMWGTPGYVSPEQALGQQVDARTDVFSFGVVVYEMLANIRPFRGETAVATMIATTRQEPRPLLEIVPHLPPAIDEIITRCLRKKKEERYADAQELSAAFEAFARGGPVSATGRISIIGPPSQPMRVAPSQPELPFVPIPEAPTTGSAAISMTTREETLRALEEQRRDRVKLIAAVSAGIAVALVALGLIVTFKPASNRSAAAASVSASAPSVAQIPREPSEPPPSEPSEPPPEPAPTLEPPPALDLPPEPPEPAPSVAVAPAPAPAPAPRPTPPPLGSGKKRKPADCAQPFVIDSKGVKIPKLHCL